MCRDQQLGSLRPVHVFVSEWEKVELVLATYSVEGESLLGPVLCHCCGWGVDSIGHWISVRKTEWYVEEGKKILSRKKSAYEE